MKQYKYHYFYKIENLINGKYYYGIHSTNNIDDGYMGSGRRLKESMRMFGKEHFVKEIIRYFDSREKASEYEASIVTEELVQDKNCYNIKCGGDYGLTIGTVLVKDANNKWLRVSINDELYKSGEYVNFMTGLVSAFDKKEEKYLLVNSDEFHSNRDRYITQTDGKVIVKDCNGNYMTISVNDERYLKGELKAVWSGRHHSNESKKKMSETHKKNHHQQGEKNSRYGTCWITKGRINKSIPKNEVEKYISDGWVKGRFYDEKGINRPSDSIDKKTVCELYEKYKNWSKVALELKIGRQTLLRYRKRNAIV